MRYTSWDIASVRLLSLQTGVNVKTTQAIKMHYTKSLTLLYTFEVKANKGKQTWLLIDFDNDTFSRVFPCLPCS